MKKWQDYPTSDLLHIYYELQRVIDWRTAPAGVQRLCAQAGRAIYALFEAACDGINSRSINWQDDWM